MIVDEIVELEAAHAAPAANEPEAGERHDAPVAYIFDGWAMVPLAVQPRA